MKKILVILLSLSTIFLVVISCENFASDIGSSGSAAGDDEQEGSDYSSSDVVYYDGRVEPCEEMHFDSQAAAEIAQMLGYTAGSCSRNGISGTCTYEQQGIETVEVYYSAYTSASAAEFYCTGIGGTFRSAE